MNQEFNSTQNVSYNNRRMPTGEYLKMKKVNYIIYAKLQQISLRNPEEQHRYVPVSLINKTQLAKEIKSKPNTIRLKLQQLEKVGLIKLVKCESGDYYKLLNDSDYYELIDLDLKFFKLMLKFTSDLVWRVYLVHKGESRRVKERYGKDTYFVTRDEIARRVGYSVTNLQTITDVNEFLKEINCIEYHSKYIHENGSTKEVNEYKVLK